MQEWKEAGEAGNSGASGGPRNAALLRSSAARAYPCPASSRRAAGAKLDCTWSFSDTSSPTLAHESAVAIASVSLARPPENDKLSSWLRKAATRAAKLTSRCEESPPPRLLAYLKTDVRSMSPELAWIQASPLMILSWWSMSTDGGGTENGRRGMA